MTATVPTIYLVRHGETAWSLTGQHTGRTDIPLTSHGEDQARRAGNYLWQLSFAQVLTSPRVRAARTCELAALGAPVSIDDGLSEWDYGDYEGLRSSEIEAARPGWNLWTDGCPNGESPDDVAARADSMIRRLRTLSGNVAVFSHGHFSCALAVRWIGQPIRCGQYLELGAGGVSALSFSAHHTSTPVLTLWNLLPR